MFVVKPNCTTKQNETVKNQINYSKTTQSREKQTTGHDGRNPYPRKHSNILIFRTGNFS